MMLTMTPKKTATTTLTPTAWRWANAVRKKPRNSSRAVTHPTRTSKRSARRSGKTSGSRSPNAATMATASRHANRAPCQQSGWRSASYAARSAWSAGVVVGTTMGGWRNGQQARCQAPPQTTEGSVGCRRSETQPGAEPPPQKCRAVNCLSANPSTRSLPVELGRYGSRTGSSLRERRPADSLRRHGTAPAGSVAAPHSGGFQMLDLAQEVEDAGQLDVGLRSLSRARRSQQQQGGERQHDQHAGPEATPWRR